MSAKAKTKVQTRRTNAPQAREPSHDEIALCAMTIWVEEGRPEGRDLEHWLKAEARLRQALQVEATAASGRRSRRTTRSSAEL